MNLDEKSKQVFIAGLLLAGMLLFVIIYYHMSVLSAKNEAGLREIQSGKSEVAALEREITDFKKFLNREDERQALLDKVEIARSRLPESEDAIEFFDIIRESARRTGIGFDRITPVAPRNQPNYREIPYDIEGNARYHEFGQFLNLIECHPERFMRVNTFDVKNNDKRPSIHPINVQISTFMFQ